MDILNFSGRVLYSCIDYFSDTLNNTKYYKIPDLFSQASY